MDEAGGVVGGRFRLAACGSDMDAVLCRASFEVAEVDPVKGFCAFLVRRCGVARDGVGVQSVDDGLVVLHGTGLGLRLLGCRGGRGVIVVIVCRLICGRGIDKVDVVAVQELLFAVAEQFFLFGENARFLRLQIFLMLFPLFFEGLRELLLIEDMLIVALGLKRLDLCLVFGTLVFHGLGVGVFFLCEQFVLTARIVQRGLAFAEFVFERGDLVQEFLSAGIFLFGSLCLLCGLRLLFGLLKQTELLCGVLRFAARLGGLGGLLRAQSLQFDALLGKSLFARGDLALPPVALLDDGVVAGAHGFLECLLAAVKIGALVLEIFELFAIARLEFSELLGVVEGGLVVQLVVASFAARHAGRRLLEDAHVHRGGGGIGEVEILVGDEAVDDGAGVLPFRLILFGDRLACLRQGKVLAPSAADRAAPVGGDVAVFFQALEGAVKRGLFERILSVALLFDLGDDLVSVFVAVIERAQNDRIDMSADEVGTDRLFGTFCDCNAVFHAMLLCFFFHYT